MNKKLIFASASILIGVIILGKGVRALNLVMSSLRSERFELSSFIAVILFASYVIQKGDEHFKK